MGYKMTEEHKKKIGESNSHPRVKKWKIKDTSNMKGKHPKTEFKKDFSPWNKGKKGVQKHSEETRKKMSDSHPKGENHPNWKGGIFKNNPYKRMLFLNSRRRALRMKAEGSHTQGEWELLKKQFGYTCPACFKKEPLISLTEDHIIPLSKGGSDYIENIQPLCRSCNCKKHTKITYYEKEG
jgi:5-methylcytosine-specific restriction endonuclease McrA